MPVAPPPLPAPVFDGPPDPNGLGAAYGLLSSSARRTTKVAVVVAGAVLESGERVESVVGGRFEGHGAVVVLTDRAVVLADDRHWKPVTERIPVEPGLEVRGWQDDRTATLTLVVDGRQLAVDQIVDRPLAVDMAQRIRVRTGAAS